MDTTSFSKASSIEEVDNERYGKGTTSRKRPKWSRDNDNEATTLKDSEDALAVTNKYRHVVLRRLDDANISCPSVSPIYATKFDRTGRLLLTAGLDGHARIFVQESNSDSYENARTLHVEELPIRRADFYGNDNRKVLLAGKRDLYVVDVDSSIAEKIVLGAENNWRAASFVVSKTVGSSSLACLGEQGRVGLFALKSRSKVATLKVSGQVTAGVFGPGIQDFTTLNSDGSVHVWDLRTNRCKLRLQNNDLSAATAIALCPSGRSLAVGTSSGTIGLFSDWHARRVNTIATPVKLVNSLITAIDGLHFNHDGNLLLASSSSSKYAVRIVDTITNFTLPNWPTKNTPLNKVFSSDFHPCSTHLAIGNARGRVLLYNLSSLNGR